MSGLLPTLRAIVRDELARSRTADLGMVTLVHSRDGDDSKNNHQVNLKLRGSGVELQRVPVAVTRLGVSALPNEGDLMLVSFIGGDLNAPIAFGCLYDEQSHPPVAKAHEVVYQPPDDGASGVRRLHLELSNGSTLTLDDEMLSVKLGDTSLTITRDGDLEVKTSGAVKFTSSGDLVLDAQGDVKISAGGKVSLAGLSVAVEGQSEAKVKGAQVAIAGLTQFSAA